MDTNGTTRKDNYLYLKLGIDYSKRAILGVNLILGIAESSSYYSSFNDANIHLYLTKKIINSIFQIVAEFQVKRYRDRPDEKLIYYNPDPEEDIQNQLLIGFEQPIMKRIYITSRIAIMRNETEYI